VLVDNFKLNMYIYAVFHILYFFQFSRIFVSMFMSYPYRCPYICHKHLSKFMLIVIVLFCFDTLQAIDGAVIGKVVASGNAKFQKDDLVLGVFTWAHYSLVKEGNILKKLESSEFPLPYYLGVLGNYHLLHIIHHLLHRF